MARVRQERLQTIWLLLLGVSFSYLLIVYLIPIAGLLASPPVQMKAIFETALYASAIVVALFVAMDDVRNDEIVFDVDDDVFYIRFRDKVAGTSCLDMISAGPSLNRMSDGSVNYNTALLLALRNGMADGVSMAYEAGVNAGEPFLRLFMTVSRTTLEAVHETLAREATRAEAILLSSLPSVELSLLRNEALGDAALCAVDFADMYGIPDNGNEEHGATFSLRGRPRVSVTPQSSQVGTFLSTGLRQGHDLVLTCVFSPTDAGREKRRMENKWHSIRSKEKRKEDSLADQTAKQNLIAEYQKTQVGDAWFNVSVYITVRERDPIRLESAQEGVKGLVLSTWGGDEPISLLPRGKSGRSFYRLSTRRHLEPQKLHVSQLAAFVNTPVQNIPVVSVVPAPTFGIPSREIVENELVVGWTVYGGRKLHQVGLKTEWLRDHVAVLGATGTGKTTLVKRLIAELSKQTTTPWWIFDVKGSEYSDLVRVAGGNAMVLRPGLDPYFVIDFLDPESGADANTTFTMLRELLVERSAASELSPAMERLLRNALFSMTESGSRDFSVGALLSSVEKLSEGDRAGVLTKDALLNRLEILKREPLGSILAGGEGAISISTLLDKRVVFDLRHVTRTGGMDAARILYNLVAKRIFDASMKRGIREGLHHVVVLEEASNLVPESYTRASAADVTTGESMVMLQRATGQGVIVVSTRPNISSNILANTATKFTFRLPYDSSAGAKYMSLDLEQERYLRSLKLGRALASIPGTESFEIETVPFKSGEYLSKPETATPVPTEETVLRKEERSLATVLALGESAEDDKGIPRTPNVALPKRLSDMMNQIIALLASKGVAVEEDLCALISTIEPKLNKARASELLEDLVSRSSIEREALPLVPGGFIYALPGNGLEGVRNVIAEYITRGAGLDGEVYREDLDSGWSRLLLGDSAVLIVPEQLKASGLQPLVDSIRDHMRRLGNSVLRYSVVIRGSVAAAKLREMMDKSDEFDAVNVVSAFPASLDRLIQDLGCDTGSKEEGLTETETSEDVDRPENELLDSELISLHAQREDQVHGSSQKRLWFGLIQGFVNLRDGRIRWNEMLEFVETTALQSLRSRTAPLSTQIGRDALTELLGDEALVAVRVGDDNQLTGLDSGLWIVNTPILKGLKDKILSLLEGELVKKHGGVKKNHEYYDMCVEDTSYLVFPTQQQLNTLLRLHSDIACRSCGSRKVVCLLTASEYMDDTVTGPDNLMLRTLDEGLSAVVP